MKETCPQTTQRMTDFIFSHRMRRNIFGLIALAPSISNADPGDFISLDDIAANIRKASHGMRRAAKETRDPMRHEFSAIGSFDRVDWWQVAHALMYSIDSVYADDYDRYVAEVAAGN
jgi:hypothetical protein